MNEELYQKLKNAYTEKNLTHITLKIIELYRNRQFGLLKKLLHKVQPIIDSDQDKPSKLFSRLILLYHPDKLRYYQEELTASKAQNDENRLHKISHILIALNHFNPTATEIKIDFEFEAVEEEYGYDREDFDDIIDVEKEYTEEEFDQADQTEADREFFDFISVLKYKEYGNLNIKFDYNDLANMEGGLDLADYGLGDLSGLEYCKNLVSLDLSGNQIIDIAPIGFLTLLEELYLSQNLIDSVDALSELLNLKRLDISFNDIQDLRPLYKLPCLEYLNVMGNEIPANQISHMKRRRVLVVK